MRARRVLTIGGSDSSGGAGIQADIKTFSALGVYGTSVLTALTAQNSSGVQAVYEVPANMVDAQLVSLMSDPGLAVDYAKTGMVYSSAVIEVVAKALRRYTIPFVLDPVMKAGSGGVLLEDTATKALIEQLLPICAVITPNVPEASFISGMEIRDKGAAKEAARRIHELGASAVILKGGHLEDELAAGKATDLLYDGTFEELSLPAVTRAKLVHGAGCSFSAALAAELANGKPLRAAAFSAKTFVHEAIARGDEVSAMVVVNHARGLRRDADRYQTLENVKEAVRMLRKLEGFANLIPEVGTNIGMAVGGAESEQDVAAVDGRIVATKEGLNAGCVEFGVSSHVARLILALMDRDKERRSAMNVKYSPEIVDACTTLGLSVSSFERAKEPAAARTMEWGVREASKEFVPDVIFDLGALGKEPMIRIFGNTAVDVVLKLRMILESLP
ncbi:MAG: bifunctional hydroxymethylpyrimidine kinase/phosphomethylpyrimidine kinase [Methanophagales archaeon ANME-1-THS]|nr:MAG: bifunctional hydroxymethylpyrimidine kinase/phosphomethylpyrimidine kinase [Methanophagales archaeon ANME-1-THS]